MINLDVSDHSLLLVSSISQMGENKTGTNYSTQHLSTIVFVAMSRFVMKSVVECLKINKIMALGVCVLYFILVTSVSADANDISNKFLKKDSKVASIILPKSRYKFSTTSAPRIKLSETPECADDIRRICPTSILNNNFAVLDCLQNDKVIS